MLEAETGFDEGVSGVYLRGSYCCGHGLVVAMEVLEDGHSPQLIELKEVA